MTQNKKKSKEPVMSLTIEVTLNTKSKLFSHAPNVVSKEPNKTITDVCTGQPGSLPVLNKEAVKKAVQFGCAIYSHVSRLSLFDRKLYFHPESPKNYVITQFHDPLIQGGVLRTSILGEIKEFFIRKAFLEEKSGATKQTGSFIGLDYNRAGAPLLKIISEPCIYSAKEAVAYTLALESLIKQLGISNEPLKVEITIPTTENNLDFLLFQDVNKNPNTLFNFFESEIKKVATLKKEKTTEEALYLPEPDLLPLVLSETYIEEIMNGLPKLAIF